MPGPDRANGSSAGRRRWLLPAIAVLVAAYAGFELGRASAGYWVAGAMTQRFELGRRVGDLEQQNAELARQVAAAEVGQQVDQQAQAEAQRMIGELQAETARQQQELGFYRGMVSRQFGSGILRVQEVRIRPEPDQPRRFLVQITLVQAATRDALATGTVSFSIDGTRRGALVQLPMQEVAIDGRRDAPFSLRYFQQIEVPIELPERFTPTGLSVEYRLRRGDEPTRQAFSWQVEGQQEAPVL